MLLFFTFATASAVEVWRIGKQDNSNDEFFSHHEYLQKFPGGAEFIVGTSNPKEIWPDTQPGPDDVWAGSKSHTVTVLFDLPEVNKEEGVIYELVIDGTAHYGQPPLFVIELNGVKQELQTEPTAESDQAYFSGKAESRSYKVAFSPDVFKTQGNKLTITSAKGSWFVYDCVRMFTRTGKIEGLNVTPLRGVTNFISEEEEPVPPYLRKVKVDYQGEVLTQKALMEIICGRATSIQVLLPNEAPYGFEAVIPVSEFDKELPVSIKIMDFSGKLIASEEFVLPLERPWEVHLIHQTHLDVGYTHTQKDVLERQVQSLKDALEYIDETKDYPPEAKFKWHPEGMWAIDEFFRTATDEEKAKFIAAAKARDIHLDALYAQAMTSLYNEEELFELMGSAVRFGKEHGVVIDSAMQTDVPGYTWGFVSALAQNGVKYLTMGPNHVHRVGRLYYWGDKPFWWVSPSGKEKVLCWMLGTGYYQFHAQKRGHQLQESEIFRLIDRYEAFGEEFPYDILMVRYGLEGDNGRPNRVISDAVKEWNEKYVYPKLVLSRNSDAMAEMEKRYGDKFPVVSGDYTGYWEDGAASTSEATAINRASHEKILQAQTLWTMLHPEKFPFARFDAAWIDMIMYDEHTWGAYNSISQPDSDFVTQQDDYKQEYAKRGARESEALLQEALKDRIDENSNVIEVFNTSSWPRKNWVTIKADAKWNSAVDQNGKPVPSQRLEDGMLVFKASVPALGSSLFTLSETPYEESPPKTPFSNIRGSETQGGAMNRLSGPTLDNLVNADHDGNRGLNDMLYIIGRNAEENRDRTMENFVGAAPLGTNRISTWTVESTAPNCEKLTRQYRWFIDEGYIEITNIVDKKMERRPEAMFFGFPFKLENGKWHYDIPWATPEVEKDQLPGANRNYYTVQRFCNFGNDKANIDWLSLDAPLMQFAPVMLQPNAYNMDADWREHIEPNGTIYSWVCNNHWETNYKAGQDGRLVFRYVVRVNNGPFDRVDSQKFAREIFQPLIAVPVKKGTKSLSGVFSAGAGVLADSPVVVTSIKPARNSSAIIVRLYNTSSEPASLSSGQSRVKLSIANTVDEPLETIGDTLNFVPYEIKTIRIER